MTKLKFFVFLLVVITLLICIFLLCYVMIFEDQTPVSWEVVDAFLEFYKPKIEFFMVIFILISFISIITFITTIMGLIVGLIAICNIYILQPCIPFLESIQPTTPSLLYIVMTKLQFSASLLVVITLLIGVAYLTLFERKIMGSGQKRLGPNVIGYEGLLQPLADGLKLFSKETILPANSNTFLFLLAPMILFTLSFLGWSVIPYNFGNVLCDLNLGFFLILSISSMNVYSILLAGWSSNSIYAFCGAVRSIAQMISYEISLGFLISVIVYCSGSLNLSDIVRSQYLVWFCFCFPLLFIMFFIVLLAETNRHPFDLPEAESELVSGYNVEYSGMLFALFFLGEYANILFTSALSTVIFFGGWLAPFTISILTFGGNFWFGIKSTLFVFINCLTRISVPRYRHDQLMSLCWKVFLPVSLYYLMTTLSSFSLIF